MEFISLREAKSSGNLCGISYDLMHYFWSVLEIMKSSKNYVMILLINLHILNESYNLLAT
jgi:hypothetical protein